MNFGIHIGAMGGPLAEMRKLWKFADAKGFDWFSVSDHFQESPPRGGDMDCYEDILEEYAQILRLLLDPEQKRANFQGKHFQASNAPNYPKPLQPRIPIWIGGRSVNLGFYLGADAKGVERADALFDSHFGGSPARAERTGYLRGSVKDAREMVARFRALGC